MIPHPDLPEKVAKYSRVEIEGWRDIPEDAYHAYPALSSHQLMTMNRTMSHWYQSVVDPLVKTATPSMEFGRRYHLALLQPNEYDRLTVLEPDFNKRTNEGKKAYKDWLSDLPEGAVIVDQEDHDKIRRMRDAFFRKGYSDLLKQGHAERAGFFNADGFQGKFKPDFLTADGIGVDLKTTTDASLSAFEYSVRKYHYDLQAAWYCRGIEAITQKPAKGWIWLAQEKTEPYETAWYIAGSTVFEAGANKVNQAMERFKASMQSNKFPGYTERPRELNLTNFSYFENPDNDFDEGAAQ